MNWLFSITLLSICSLPFVFSQNGHGAEWADTTFEKFPFMANLFYNGKGNCGGSIISKNPGVILTAAHCIVGAEGKQFNPYDIEVGIGCTRSDCSKNGYAKRYGVADYRVHDQYENKEGLPVPPFDIGLLYLDGPITQTQAREISLLPSMDGIAGGHSLRGLGYYGFGASDVDTLETHWTQIVSNSKCAGDTWGDLGKRIDTICVEDMQLERGDAICGVGMEDNAGLCYPYCRSGYYGNGPVCWGSCPSGYQDHPATCYKSLIPADYFAKHSYGRGVGKYPIEARKYESTNKHEQSGRKQGFGPGDSGSPVIYEQEGERYQIALVSAVSKKVYPNGAVIPDPNAPQLLTSTVSFYDWIYNADAEIYDFPSCQPDCLVNNGGCPNGNCHQKEGSIYRKDGLCYMAMNGCWGCLWNPGLYPDALQPVSCFSGNEIDRFEVFEYPDCKPHCLRHTPACGNVECHQVSGIVYRVDGNCYEAQDNCWGCLDNPKNYPNQLKPVSCTTKQSAMSIGCYRDTSNRAMIFKGNGYKTPISCGTACTESGYKYFALQYPPNAECFCSNDLTHSTHYGKHSQCQNGRGGAWANSIYKFGACSLTRRDNCYQITDRDTCLTAMDGRTGFLDQPCVWCGGASCTTINGNKCEPQDHLAVVPVTTKVEPEKWEYASDCPNVSPVSSALAISDLIDNDVQSGPFADDKSYFGLSAWMMYLVAMIPFMLCAIINVVCCVKHCKSNGKYAKVHVSVVSDDENEDVNL